MRPLLMTCLALAAACDNPFALPRATTLNVVDTVSLYALNGTPPATPSGYLLQFRQVVRVDQGGTFDFAVDVDTGGHPVLKPTGALRLGRNSGVRLDSLPFDSIKIAPDRGFQLDSAVRMDVGSVAIVHSRAVRCSFDIPAVYYAKLQILELDTLARRLRFQILVDTNCGYRGLERGVPSR
jgi:hypothetical protein